MKDNSIKKLVDKDLCFQCGTCYSACPIDAIKMVKNEDRGLTYPLVNKDKCIECRKCLNVCPINNLDYYETHLPSDKDFIGIYNTSDSGRLEYTASGGIVTEILVYLFDNNIINKAIVTGMDKHDSTSSKTYIIEDKFDLKSISGSVYQPSSVNEALKYLDKDDKVAIVGLPCHIRGVDRLCEIDKEIEKAILYKIGIICSIGRGKNGTKLMLEKKLKVKDFKEIKNLKYRLGMPPGEFIVELRNGEIIKDTCVDFNQHTDYIFMPKGCLFCNDLFNYKADITVGDPWGLNKGKKAMAIVRNNNIKRYLDEMVSKKYLEFDEKISSETCINTQAHSVEYKINNYLARMQAYECFNIKIPNIKNTSKVNVTLKEKIGYRLLLMNSLIFNSKMGYKIAYHMPNKILFKYRNKILQINTTKRRECDE